MGGDDSREPVNGAWKATYGSHRTTALSQSFVADRVHAAVDPMQAPRANAMVDRLTTEAERDELPVRNDPVLARGERPKSGIRTVRVQLFSHSE